MTMGERLWHAPENKDYMVQALNEANKWHYLSTYLYTLPEAIEFASRQWGHQMVRVVKVCRYLPDGAEDPVVKQVVKEVKPERGW
jgi:hypothetical protein